MTYCNKHSTNGICEKCAVEDFTQSLKEVMTYNDETTASQYIINGVVYVRDSINKNDPDNVIRMTKDQYDIAIRNAEHTGFKNAVNFIIKKALTADDMYQIMKEIENDYQK